MGSPVHETARTLDVTNRFVLDFARSHGGRILDYGCGAGRLVRAGLDAGLTMWGTDVFYGGSTARAEAEAAGLLGGAVREMIDGRIPFEDNYFDLVTNNQVMEHVEDLDTTLREISRVLRPGGTVLSIFPSRDVWREGHIGIPLSHRMPKGKARLLYTWALRSAGLGTWKEQAPTARQWAIDKLEWIDRWTRYRSREEILATYAKYFDNQFAERDYIRFRLLDKRTPVREALARWIGAPHVGLFRKLAFLVIVSVKR